jgi:putative two-component system response regulator
LARVLQVVDIYDALTHPRPYKHAYSTARALEILQDEIDRGWRDKEIARLFIRMHRNVLAKIADPCDGNAAGTVSVGESLRNLQTQLMQ